MLSPEEITQVVSLITNAQTIMVLFPANATHDQIVTASVLHQGLSQLGKQVQILSPQAVDGQYQSILGANSVQTQLGNKNLHVIFDYTPEQVDKVSYDLDDEQQKFYLIVQPQKGYSPLDASKVQFAYAGAEADLILLVGVRDWEQLDQLYVGYEDFYKDTTSITLNTYKGTLANINLDTSGSAAMAEAIMPILEQLQVSIQDEMATHMLTAIEIVTEGFSSPTTTASTFETVAKLLRSGARRVRRAPQPIAAPSPMPIVHPDTSAFSQTLQRTSKPAKPSDIEVKPVAKGKRNGAKAVPVSEEPTSGGLNYQPSGMLK